MSSQHMHIRQVTHIPNMCAASSSDTPLLAARSLTVPVRQSTSPTEYPSDNRVPVRQYQSDRVPVRQSTRPTEYQSDSTSPTEYQSDRVPVRQSTSPTVPVQQYQSSPAMAHRFG
eukprot:2995412-Pyramimonas_sp.AAC.1